MEGSHHECLSLIDEKYYHLRRYFLPAGTASLPLHSCNRDAKCDCGLLTSYLLAIGFARQERDVGGFLESNGVFEPQLRLPFEQFIEWIQLEVYRGHHEKADELLRNYIFHSTRLRAHRDEENSEYKSMWSSIRKPGFGSLGSGNLGSNSRDLPLAKEEYYELLELLVFYILLPSKGYSETKRQMQQLPMPKSVREAFDQRLVDMRNTVVADLRISDAEKELMALNPPKEEQSENSSQIIAKTQNNVSKKETPS